MRRHQLQREAHSRYRQLSSGQILFCIFLSEGCGFLAYADLRDLCLFPNPMVSHIGQRQESDIRKPLKLVQRINKHYAIKKFRDMNLHLSHLRQTPVGQGDAPLYRHSNGIRGVVYLKSVIIAI